MNDVFISYSSKDYDSALCVRGALSAHNLSVWMAPGSLRPGDIWAEAINNAIRTSKVFLLLFNENSNVSKQVLNEIDLATKYCDTIIPFRLDSTQMSMTMEYYLGRPQWVELDGEALEPAAKKLAELIAALCEAGASHEAPVPPAVKTAKPEAPAAQSDMQLLLKKAESGDAIACNELGNAYYYGKGTKKDYQQAVKWFERAAKGGSAWAMYNLGWCYKKGQGVEQSMNMATYWFRCGADKDNIAAIKALARCYFNGEGVPRDYEEGLALLDKAALTDNEARLQLGKYLISGTYGAADPDRGCSLIRLVADAGDKSAKYELANCMYNGQGTPKDLAGAVALLEPIAEDSPATQFLLGLCYAGEQSPPRDYKRAAYWYERAAAAGFTGAMNNLGILYADGRGVEQSNTLALKWMTLGAQRGDSFAMLNLGNYYRAGSLGLKKDLPQALTWLRAASDKGNAGAQALLAQMLIVGEGTDKRPQHAYEWACRSAEQGNRDGLVLQATMLWRGEGVKKDRAASYAIKKRLADSGDAIQQYNLALIYFGREKVPGVAQDNDMGRYYMDLCLKSGSTLPYNFLCAVYARGMYSYPKDSFLSALYALRAQRVDGKSGVLDSIAVSQMHLCLDDKLTQANDHLSAGRIEDATIVYTDCLDAVEELELHSTDKKQTLIWHEKVLDFGEELFKQSGNKIALANVHERAYAHFSVVAREDPSYSNLFSLALYAYYTGVYGKPDRARLTQAQSIWQELYNKYGKESCLNNARLAGQQLERLIQ